MTNPDNAPINLAEANPFLGQDAPFIQAVIQTTQGDQGEFDINVSAAAAHLAEAGYDLVLTIPLPPRQSLHPVTQEVSTVLLTQMLAKRRAPDRAGQLEVLLRGVMNEHRDLSLAEFSVDPDQHRHEGAYHDARVFLGLDG